VPKRIPTSRILALTIVATALSAPVVHTAGTPENRSSAGVRDPKSIVPAVARAASFQLPLRFEQASQSRSNRTPFVARGAGYTVSVSGAGATLLLKGGSATTARPLTMSLAGGRRHASAQPRRALPGVSNYLIGNDSAQWVRGVRGYAEIEYREVYPGVDVVYYGTQQELEYDFVVAPGSSPDVIALAYDGATGLRLDDHGELVIATVDGDVVQHRPEIYQNDQGARRAIRGGYVIRRDGTIGFRVGKYNRRLPLVIDPILSYGTYLGGTGFERVGGVAIDAAGNVIVAGTTPSVDFPVVNPIQPQPRGADLFVVKLSPAGDALVYATYFGGTGYDSASALAVDDAGNAYVSGHTESWDFPATTQIGPQDGFSDAFVVKLDPAGGLAYATRIGGGGQDYVNAIAVDAPGRARIVGNTISGDFPVVDALQPQLGGNAAFHSTDGGQTWLPSDTGLKTAGVVAFGFDASQPATAYAATLREGVFRTLDGGATWTQTSLPKQPVRAFAIQGGAVFAAADMGVYRTSDHGENWTPTSPSVTLVTSIVATSASPSVLYAGQGWSGGVFRSQDGGVTWSYAGLPGPVQFLAAGGTTVYAATTNGVFRSTAGAPWVAWNTRLRPTITALAVDTNDPQVAYVGTDTGLLKTVSGGTDWFPLLEAGTPYIGAIAVSPSDPSTVFISSSWGTAVSHDAGQSWSPTGLRRDAWPTTMAVDPRDSGNVYAGTQLNWDAFLATLSPDGSRLEYATFIGGRGSDIGNGVAVDPSGNTYVAGETISTDFPTTNAIQAAPNGLVDWDWDAFVMKLSPQGVPVYSTYLGGSGTEFGGRIAADAAGRAYVTGNTWSPDFPVVNAAQPSPGGNGDMFVTALNASGSAFVYSTYLGGSGYENAQGSIEPSIAVTSAGEAAVTGATQSIDFPTTVDAVQRTPGGGDDAFLSRFDPAGALQDSTFLGRAGADYGQAVAVDPTGTAVVAGYTNSTNWATPGAVQPANRGADDAFVVKIIPGTPPPDTVAPTTTIAVSGNTGLPGWYNSPVTVSLSAVDNDQGRGVAYIEYSLNGGLFQRYTTPFVVTASGATQITARGTDWAGNVESPPRSTTVAIDTTPPTIGFTLSGTAGADDWYRSSVTVSVSAVDASPSTGLNSTEYRIGSAPFQLYTAPFVVSTEGITQVTARAIDRNGNMATSTRAVRIDTTAPRTNIAISGTPGLAGWYRSPVTVSLSAVDNASGVGAAGIVYRINDGTFQPYTSPFVVAAEGTTRITARATDRAGNVESALPSPLFMIDSSAPTVTITSPQARDYLHSDSLVVSFSAADNLSGMQSVAATLDTYTVQNSLSVPLRLLPLGVHTLHVSATDAAGNAVTQSVSFRIVATIDSLIASVNFYTDEGMINVANQRSLLAKLDDAKAALERGNASGAAGKLRDFIDQCRAQSGRGIGTDTAVVLIADAQYVLATL
jgi:hypothetical protein